MNPIALYTMAVISTYIGVMFYRRYNNYPVGADFLGLPEVVSTDEIREQYGFGHSAHDLQRTWDLAKALVKARLEAGFRVVLDATNIKRKDRLNILKIVPRGQLVRYVVIDRRLEDKEASRGDRSLDLVQGHHKTFISNLKDILAGDYQPNVVVEDRREHKV